MINTEQYIDHEKRIRILENLALDTNKKLDRLDDKIDSDKIDSRFMLLIGLILTSIIMPVVLHAVRLV